jgi:hypothetical protein
MGNTAALFCVSVRLRGPDHADDYQPRGDIEGEGAALLGNEVEYGFATNLPGVLTRLAALNDQLHTPPLGGAV